jgi:hypothetical protein
LLDVRRDKRERASFAALSEVTRDLGEDEDEDGDEQENPESHVIRKRRLLRWRCGVESASSQMTPGWSDEVFFRIRPLDIPISFIQRTSLGGWQ